MREKLLRLLKESDFISGEVLAKKLQVSRTAIWKQIKKLKEIGYKIESVKNKGYHLVSNPDIPIPEEITPFLKSDIVGREIYYFEKVDSTNNIARDFIKKEPHDGTIIVSDIQTQGRGRKDRQWISPKGGLWFSIILYPNIQPEKGMLLTMAISISIVEALKIVAGLDSEIKWPNDLLLNKRKVCGVLTEFDAETDKINYAIVGVGINVNNEIDESLKNTATSLKKEKREIISKVELMRYIITYFDKYYRWVRDNKHDKIRDKWLSYSNIIGKKVIVKQNKNTIEGIVKYVDKNGFLIIDDNKKETRILSGDITYN